MADTTMNIVIDEKTKEKLEQISVEQYRTLSAQVRFIIENWLEKYK